MINIQKWNNNKEIKKILNESFNEAADMIKNKTLVISFNNNEEIMGIICLISNENLVKFLSKTINFEEINNFYSIRATNGCYLYNLAVKKQYRKNGLSKKLLNAALYVSNILNFKYCHAHCENKISELVFKKRGFIQEKVYKNKKNKDIKLVTIWI